MGPGVWRRPTSACYTRRKCSMETSHKSVKGRVRGSSGGSSLDLVRLQTVIQHSWERKFVLFDEIPLSNIKLFQWRYQAFFDVSQFEKLIWKSCRPQIKTSIRGASPGISYKLRNKDAIGWRGSNIATPERKICDVEIEIITFVINGRVKLTVPPDRQKQIKSKWNRSAITLGFVWQYQ